MLNIMSTGWASLDSIDKYNAEKCPPEIRALVEPYLKAGWSVVSCGRLNVKDTWTIQIQHLSWVQQGDRRMFWKHRQHLHIKEEVLDLKGRVSKTARIQKINKSKSEIWDETPQADGPAAPEEKPKRKRGRPRKAS